MRVVIGVPVSPRSDAILAAVTRFPWPTGTEVHVLCVAEKVHPSVLELMGTTVEGVQRREDLRASAIASAAAAHLSDAGIAAEAKTVEGDPQTELVEYAKQWGADLIVVGSEREGKLKRVLIGSVATAVVTNAHCSVLVIRTAPEETPE
jgi:nucleotide-binding universal stress UspA family protein